MWENYVPGYAPPRRILISEELHDMLNSFKERTGRSAQSVFDRSSHLLRMIWTDHEDISNNICPREECETKVEHILNTHPMPGKIIFGKNEGNTWGDEKAIAIMIRTDIVYEWFILLEKNGLIDGFSDGIRRMITWYLTEHLEDQ